MQRLSRNSSYTVSQSHKAKSIIMRTKWHPTLHHQRKSTTTISLWLPWKNVVFFLFLFCFFFFLPFPVIGVCPILARSRSCYLEFYWNWIQFPVRLDNKLLEFCIYFDLHNEIEGKSNGIHLGTAGCVICDVTTRLFNAQIHLGRCCCQWQFVCCFLLK